MMFRTERRKHRFQLFRCCAALAADTQRRDAWDDVQGFTPGRQRQREICAVGGVGGHHTRGRRTLNGPIGGITHRLTRQQCAADFLDALRLCHGAVLAPGPFIHSKNAAPIGGRRDDRHRAANRRQPPRQVVCAAQMPRQQRDSKLTALVQYHNGRVSGLAAAVGRDGPHRNSGSPHKNQCITLCKLPGRPVGQRHAVCAAAGHTARARSRQPLRQCQPPRREGDIRANHASVPLRNAVVNAGS